MCDVSHILLGRMHVNIREEILNRALKTGKEAYAPTTMAISLVEAALKPASK